MAVGFSTYVVGKIKIYREAHHAIYCTHGAHTQLQLEKPVWAPQALCHTARYEPIILKLGAPLIHRLLLLILLLLQSAIKQFVPHAMSPLNQNSHARGHKYMQDVGRNI